MHRVAQMDADEVVRVSEGGHNARDDSRMHDHVFDFLHENDGWKTEENAS